MNKSVKYTCNDCGEKEPCKLSFKGNFYPQFCPLFGTKYSDWKKQKKVKK
jgi:hypothetical protein